MNPENVNPRNFRVESILYDNGRFSIAYGIWENENYRIAMRWNGASNEPGYPKLFNNPVWFVIDRELTPVLLNSIMFMENSDNEKIIKALEFERNVKIKTTNL